MSRCTISIVVGVTCRTVVTLVLLARIFGLTHLAEPAASSLYTCLSAYRQQGDYCFVEAVLRVSQPSASTGWLAHPRGTIVSTAHVYVSLLVPLLDGPIQLYSA